MQADDAGRVVTSRERRAGGWTATVRRRGGVELESRGAVLEVRAGRRGWAVVAGAPAPGYWRGRRAGRRGALLEYDELYWADCRTCRAWPRRALASKRRTAAGVTHRDTCLNCGSRADIEPPRARPAAAAAAAAALGRRGPAARAYALRT